MSLDLVVWTVPLMVSAWPVEPPARRTPPPELLPLERSLRKASAGGKYAMLLRQIKAPRDAEKYGDFRDVGTREVKEHAGHTDLPKGHWVYVYPYWYIWRDLAAAPRPKRPWGPEQATGPPDTPQPGDVQTAWASATEDGQDEWLLLEYAEPFAAEAVLVYETYNPGALCRVTVFRLDGEEVEVWKGKDPTPPNQAMGVSEVNFRVPFKTSRVKIYLDSKRVRGWNEIDAVGLRDPAGTVHWAVSAEASSTFAEANGGALQLGQFPVAQPLIIRAQFVPAQVVPAPLPVPGAPPPAAPAQPAAPRGAGARAGPAGANAPLARRVEELEKEVRQLKQVIRELTERLDQKPADK
jgi:hypothetical protein